MKKKIIGALTVLTLSASLMGCGSEGYSNYSEETKKTNKPIVNYTVLIENKLYYIPHERGTQDFPSRYREFINNNPEVKIIQVEPDLQENTQNNFINGYFIFTEIKE